MNKQRPPHGIEWTRVWGRPGLTANPVKGCKHGCEWEMPDGDWSICYAKELTQRLLAKAYPNGFEEIRFDPSELRAMEQLEEPSGIFIDSMSDLFGAGVPEDWIMQVLASIERAPQHIVMSLTKNAGRMEGFSAHFPPNLWLGVSAPPTKMHGHVLTPEQQLAFVLKALQVLRRMAPVSRVRWMSVEPLSFDIAKVFRASLADGDFPLEWMVIGAMSRGCETFQPNPRHVDRLLAFADRHGVKVFFKGNLKWSPWRAEFPPEVSRDCEGREGERILNTEHRTLNTERRAGDSAALPVEVGHA